MGKKKKKEAEAPPSTWLNTYSDMITLCLCFFVILFNPDDVTQAQLDAISTSIQTGGLGALAGGLTLSSGRMAELGNTIMSLPSMERGRSLGTALRKAISVFFPGGPFQQSPHNPRRAGYRHYPRLGRVF